MVAILFLNYGATKPLQAQELTSDIVELSPQDRILILAPHPDDEILGCGGIIQRAKKMNLPVKIVFLTYGDNNQWSFLVYRKHLVVMPKAVQGMGMVRHDEAIEAAKVLGLSAKQLVFLGYPDFYTFDIWSAHWGSAAPAKDMLTEAASVPYTNAFRTGAPYKGEEILKDLKAILQEFEPTKIFLSHPADHNGDHRALYLFTRVALWELGNETKIRLYPYLIHYKNWPLPRGYHPSRRIIPPDIFKNEISWLACNLDQEEIDKKCAAIKKHRSQYQSSASYLLSFIRANEFFGDFPAVRLISNTFEELLSATSQDESKDIPEELLDEERAAFVGVRKYSVGIKDNNLIISVKLSRPLGKTVGVSLYAFGYRKDRDFAKMPKFHIKFGAVGHKVLNQNKILSPKLIKTKRTSKEITINIPLSLLGNPQKILTSAQTYLGEVPLDWVSWRIVEINK